MNSGGIGLDKHIPDSEEDYTKYTGNESEMDKNQQNMNTKEDTPYAQEAPQAPQAPQVADMEDHECNGKKELRK